MNKQHDTQKTERDSVREPLGKMSAMIAQRAIDGEPLLTPVPGLSFHRYSEPTQPKSATYEPSLCLAVQGKKRVRIGEETFTYGENHFLITSIHLPAMVRVIEASPETPYLGLVLRFDQRELAQLMVDSNLPAPRAQKSSLGMSTSSLTPELLSAFQRLVGLLDQPEDIPILAPIITKEILYRLLMGDQGTRLRQIASAGSQSHQIARAIDWLKGNYFQSLRVEDLASEVSMSVSTFHQHFRLMTGLSPLQYQKNLRLHEARLLMLNEQIDAATAAFQVGYESPSQFSREYKRMYGAPPARDIKELGQAGQMG